MAHVQVLEIQVEIDSHHWQPRCPPRLRTGSFAPSPRDEFAFIAAPVSWHMFSRSVNRKCGSFALQLNEMARQLEPVSFECDAFLSAGCEALVDHDGLRELRPSCRSSATGNTEQATGAVVCTAIVAGAVSQAMVPFTIGLNAVRLSRSAAPPRPLFANTVVKLPCSPCSAM